MAGGRVGAWGVFERMRKAGEMEHGRGRSWSEF